MDKPASDWDPGEGESVAERMARQKDMRERCPLAYTDRADGYWTLLRYADIEAVSLDTETFSNASKPRHGPRLPPLEVDPPLHRQYRRILNPFFSMKHVKSLEPRVRAIADGLIDPLLDKKGATSRGIVTPVAGAHRVRASGYARGHLAGDQTTVRGFLAHRVTRSGRASNFKIHT